MILDILTALFMVSSLFLIFLMIAEWRRDVLHGHYVAGSTGRNNLRLRPIGRDEFAVIENGHSIGRIIFAGEASIRSGCGILPFQGTMLPARPLALRRQN